MRHMHYTSLTLIIRGHCCSEQPWHVCLWIVPHYALHGGVDAMTSICCPAAHPHLYHGTSQHSKKKVSCTTYPVTSAVKCSTTLVVACIGFSLLQWAVLEPATSPVSSIHRLPQTLNALRNTIGSPVVDGILSLIHHILSDFTAYAYVGLIVPSSCKVPRATWIVVSSTNEPLHRVM